MRKITISFIIFCMTFYTSFAEIWDVLYVKFMHSPVVTSLDNSSQILTILQKWFVVLDLWQEGEYTQVMLTDGKKWYILTSHLENYTFSNYKINGNKGSISKKTTLYSGPNLASKNLGILPTWSEFYILHVNYINSKFLKVKIINGPLKNKIWYIEWNNVNISHISNFKNEIEKFIEKYAKQEPTQLTFLNATKNNNDYIPLFWEENLNTTISIFQQQAQKNNTLPSATENSSENLSDFSDFFNLLNGSLNTSDTNNLPSTNTNNSTQNNNDFNDFFNLLNGSLNSNELNSGGNSHNTNTSIQNNNDLNDFFNLLNGSF